MGDPHVSRENKKKGGKGKKRGELIILVFRQGKGSGRGGETPGRDKGKLLYLLLLYLLLLLLYRMYKKKGKRFAPKGNISPWPEAKGWLYIDYYWRLATISFLLISPRPEAGAEGYKKISGVFIQLSTIIIFISPSPEAEAEDLMYSRYYFY
jgi:hypothetical protein